MDPHEVAATARIGQVLRGKWTLERVLGIGGMATVYEASHRNGLRAAVKILHPAVVQDPSARQRFLREGYVANQVEHGAVRVLDDDTTEDGTVFLVMELLEGTTVEAMAARRPGERLEQHEVVKIALQLLDTLVFAHAAGIVHRDIKPENLFLTRSGELRVLDFGIARLREHAGGAVRATSTQTSMGTPAFMPPEQVLARWDDVGPHSDVYSVGATMFALLTGQLTHEATTAPELMVAVATLNARPLRSLFPGASVELANVVDRALAHSPRNRFADASSMRDALLEVSRAIGERSDPGPISGTAPQPLLRGAGGTLPSRPVLPVVSARSLPVEVVDSRPSSPGEQKPWSPPAAEVLRPGTRAASSTTSPVSSGPSTPRLHPKRGLGYRLGIAAGALGVVLVGAVGVWRVTHRDLSGDSSQGSASSRVEPADTANRGSPGGSSTVAIPPETHVEPAPPTITPSVEPLPSASASAKPSAESKPTTKDASSKPKPKPKPSIDLTRSD